MIFEFTLNPVYPVLPAAEIDTGKLESSLSKYVRSSPNLLFKTFNSIPYSNSVLIPPVKFGLARVFGTAKEAKEPYAVPDPYTGLVA